MNRPRFREIFREKELWLLEGLSAVFFATPLFGGRTYFLRDLYQWIFPQRRRLVELVHSEGLPLWDPVVNGGQPFLGEISNTARYPSAILGFVLPPVVAFNVEIVLHFLLCGLAAYLLARVLGLSRLAALVAGATRRRRTGLIAMRLVDCVAGSASRGVLETSGQRCASSELVGGDSASAGNCQTKCRRSRARVVAT